MSPRTLGEIALFTSFVALMLAIMAFPKVFAVFAMAVVAVVLLGIGPMAVKDREFADENPLGYLAFIIISASAWAVAIRAAWVYLT